MKPFSLDESALGEPGDGRSTPGGDASNEQQSDHMERDDVVNCICQINEENGLMIQVRYYNIISSHGLLEMCFCRTWVARNVLLTV